jgi:hypothetical protein
LHRRRNQSIRLAAAILRSDPSRLINLISRLKTNFKAKFKRGCAAEVFAANMQTQANKATIVFDLFEILIFRFENNQSSLK